MLTEFFSKELLNVIVESSSIDLLNLKAEFCRYILQSICMQSMQCMYHLKNLCLATFYSFNIELSHLSGKFPERLKNIDYSLSRKQIITVLKTVNDQLLMYYEFINHYFALTLNIQSLMKL